MEMIGVLFMVIAALIGIGSLVCFILVVVQMFKHDMSGLGIATIILALCTGIGGLIAYVMGWVKSSEWGLKKVMLIWTGCIVGSLFFYCAGAGIIGMAAGSNANRTFGTVGSSIGTSWPK